MNELTSETSPYLLQHAQNPVHWKAWNSKTLEQARNENKLIIVSTGYSACHWCHVMEHESFENDEAAKTMNDHFISIKVDREERPDIDAVYMKAVQIMTGRGGWPMNVICLPDGRPVWGASYVPRKEWISYLEQLAEMYASDPDKLLEYAQRLHAGIASMNIVKTDISDSDMSQKALVPLVKKWKKSFDHDYGGYGRAPKFMMPTDLKFLMRYGHQNDHPEIISHVNLTLTKMAYGGLFDTVGGGFSRYSVDMKWHVPHFEKMLYDNAQLVSLYSNAYKLSKNPLYKEVAEKTLEFINRELTHESGGFYCALDADSLDSHGKLEEGAYYVWTIEELQNLLADDFPLFEEIFNVNDFGHWENGNYVLIQNQSLEEIANRHDLSPAQLHERKTSWERILLLERSKRNRPRLDDKCLTSWNALMIIGYTDAYKAFNEEAYLTVALKNAQFLIDTLWGTEGNLFHNYKDGKVSINGYLEDYCFVISAFIAIYECTLDDQWLNHAKRLTDYCFDHFFVNDKGFFAFTSDLDAELITQHFEIEDNVIPASNSVMANNLYRLGIYFSNTHYSETCRQMLQQIIPTIDYPSAFSNWMEVFMNYSDKNNEVAICGKGAHSNIRELGNYYLPNIVLAGSDERSYLPFLHDKFPDSANTLYYICTNGSCHLPLEDKNEAFKTIITQPFA